MFNKISVSSLTTKMSFLALFFSITVLNAKIDLIPEQKTETTDNKVVPTEVAPTKVATELPAKSLEGSLSLDSIQNGEFNINALFQEMAKIFSDAKKREEERKLLYFSKLSTQHQELLKNSQEKLNNFLEMIDIRNGLAKLSKDVRIGLEKLKAKGVTYSKTKGVAYSESETALLQKNILAMQKLETSIALGYCPFLPKRMSGLGANGIEDMSAVMKGLMQNFMPPDQDSGLAQPETKNAEPNTDIDDPELVFSIDDVLTTIESLNILLNSDILKGDIEFSVGMLSDILTAISHDNQKEIIACYIAYLEPEYQATLENLKATKKIFENEVKAYIANYTASDTGKSAVTEHELTEKAYIFWFKEIKKNMRTLLVFSTLKDASGSLVQGTEKFFDIMAYTYDVANCFYGFYQKDISAKYAIKEIKDQADKEKKPGMLQNIVNNVVNNVSQQMHEDVLIPKAVDWGFRSGFAAWYFFMKRPEMSGGLLYQSFLGNIPLSMLDVKQSTLLNFMILPFASFVFLSPSFWNYQQPDLIKSFGKIAGAWGYYHLIGCQFFGEDNNVFWPSEYNHLRSSIFDFLTEAESLILKNISSSIRRNTNPELIEKIETYSLGIIKPEMIGTLADAMVPLILLGNKDGLDLLRDNDDFFWSIFNKSILTDYWKLSPQKNQPSVFSYYLEASIVYYVASCVGKTLGKSITRKVQGPVINATMYVGGKCLDGLARMHIISEDMRDTFSALKEEVNEGFEENMMFLKMMIKEIFKANSSFKKMLVFQLKKRGDISLQDNAPDEVVNIKLAGWLLKQCTDRDVISYSDATAIMHNLLEKQTIDDELIEKIILALKNNILAKFGGMFGQWGVKKLARILMQKHGPFTPKIANAFS